MSLRKKIDFILGRLLIVILGVMVINVLWQVFSRYVLGNPSSFTDELARYLMIWLGIFGAAYVSGRNMHVAIDVLPNRFNRKAQRKIKFLVNIIIILASTTILIIGGFRLVFVTYILEQSSPALEVPLALVYVALPLSGLLINYYKADDILNR
ncbi:TRAP transporter small permease [Maribacter sp. 2308TA10-17]|uniref:TRAP transporter small permease n=1 Tax=Maribacter sp. 2308TA10-17 TaxID=3386276 RepID=UPI0039BCE91F